ncbi:MAG TPA: hypothetical protein DCP61_05495 [Treponema sp.]|nr:hypothetical protein [Treponema sp.]
MPPKTELFKGSHKIIEKNYEFIQVLQSPSDTINVLDKEFLADGSSDIQTAAGKEHSIQIFH